MNKLKKTINKLLIKVKQPDNRPRTLTEVYLTECGKNNTESLEKLYGVEDLYGNIQSISNFKDMCFDEDDYYNKMGIYDFINVVKELQKKRKPEREKEDRERALKKQQEEQKDREYVENIKLQTTGKPLPPIDRLRENMKTTGKPLPPIDRLRENMKTAETSFKKQKSKRRQTKSKRRSKKSKRRQTKSKRHQTKSKRHQTKSKRRQTKSKRRQTKSKRRQTKSKRRSKK